MKQEEIDVKRLAPIIKEYRSRKWPLIPLLQRVQDEFGYIPSETIEPIAKNFNLFPRKSQVLCNLFFHMTGTWPPSIRTHFSDDIPIHSNQIPLTVHRKRISLTNPGLAVMN